MHRVFGYSFGKVYPLYVDKLVDEVAQGRTMEKILRQPAPQTA